MQPITAIIVGQNDSVRSQLAARLFTPGGPFLNGGMFASDDAANAWTRAGGRADVVVRAISPTEPAPVSSLTGRERDVLTLLAKGLAYADIGRTLGIRLGTVQCHIKRLYSKLDVNTKAEAALFAASLGLV